MKSFFLKLYFFKLAVLTKIYLRRTRPLIIGMTGSVGKTSCRMIITQVLKQLLPEKNIYTSPKNFNSEIGLILSIFQIESYEPNFRTLFSLWWKILFSLLFPKNIPDILVLEYGIDHPHDMKFLTMISKADIAIFTKLDAVHSENFPSVEAVGDEKFLLMKTAKQRVYLNFLDAYCKHHTEDIKAPLRFYNQGDLEIQKLSYSSEGEHIFTKIEGNFGEITTNLMGVENMAYIVIALDIASFVSTGSIHQKNHHFDLSLQAGRFTTISQNDNIIIDSSYNAAPESMRVMIENTKILRENVVPNYKIGFCIGDMRELGENSSESHRALVSFLLDADFIFTVGPEMKSYLVPELLKNNYKGLLKNFLSSREAGKELKIYLESIGNQSVILFKGSQNTIFMEEALKEVLGADVSQYELVRQTSDWIKKKEEFFTKK